MCDQYSFPEKEPLMKKIFDIIDPTIEVEKRYYYQPGTAKHDKLNAAITDDTQIYRFSDWGIQASKDGISFTLKANMGTYYDRVPIIKDKFGIRCITPTECLALQGFPDSFLFGEGVPEKEMYKQAGNTVVFQLINKMLAWGD